MTEPALSIQSITKAFGRVKALDAVAFEVPAGSIFGLLGPNGAGKTTLFSIAAGFLHADTGSLRVLGTDIAHIADLQGRMTILPQDAAFQRNVPILEQLLFFRQLDGSGRADARREVLETLDLVGLAAYQKRGVHALSHGMLKRMGIAQAFLGRPELILLDEPTAGLDPQNARQIRDLVRVFRQQRAATTVVSSHNLAEIQELCDHVAILDKGRLLVAGPVDAILRQSRQLDLLLARELTAQERAELAALPCSRGLEARELCRYRLQLAIPDGESADGAIAAVLRWLLDRGVTPRSLQEGNSLEEYFLQLTGKEHTTGH
ncbi:MAG: ABC transporter ATP-binding protein [Planctomycetes bacterium]|nr:ABC transporter ATP-binding protein [Planctomycetota bacterium]